MELLFCPQVARLRALEDFNVSLCTSHFPFKGALQTQLGASQKTCIITAEGRAWNKEETCKASYTYATFYCAPFRYSYGCFGFRFDSFFFFLSVLLHTKETDTAQYFNGTPAIPDRPRFHWSMLCCSALRCRQTGAVMMKRRLRLLIKKTPPFPLQITVLRENYTGKKAPLPQPRLQDAVLFYWMCQIKHIVGGAWIQRVQKNDYKTCLMEVIDRLFTDKAHVCFLFRDAEIFGESCLLTDVFQHLKPGQGLETNSYDACTVYHTAHISKHWTNKWSCLGIIHFKV